METFFLRQQMSVSIAWKPNKEVVLIIKIRPLPFFIVSLKDILFTHYFFKRNLSMSSLQPIIEEYFEIRQQLSPQHAPGELLQTVNAVISMLDAGELRVAQKKENNWVVNQWIKK